MITLRKPRRAKRIKNLLPDKAKVTRSGPSKLEARFSLLWQGLQGPELESEFRFHPIRKWRADFVHHGSKTLIEVEGGIWGRGRHNTGAGMAADMEKYLEATLAGYRVIRLCDKQLNLETVARVVGYCNAGVATPPATPAPVVW